MTHAQRIHSESITISTLSIFFYGLVASIAFYYYQKFSYLQNLAKTKQTTNNNTNNNLNTSSHGGEEEEEEEGEITPMAVTNNAYYYRTNIGQYDEVKKSFFLILTISSCLEIPTYIGCLIQDGPQDCEWNEISFVFTWFLHCIALCGYAYCIVLPPILWSDMINKRDGKLFFSYFPYDTIKRCFQFFLIAYWTMLSIDILCVIGLDRISDPMYFYTLPSYKICATLDCMLISCISICCLYCGIQLQIYVRKAKLQRMIEIKFLFTLNIILMMIVLSLLGRAVLVIQFASFIPESYQHPTGYAVFIVVTRWMPDVFCQLCLILTMRTPSSEIANNNTNRPSVRSSWGSAGRGEKDDEMSGAGTALLQNVGNTSNQKEGRETTSTDFLSFFSVLMKRTKRSGRPSSKSSSHKTKGGLGDSATDDLQNPFIDSRHIISSEKGEDSSFAFSAIESHDGELDYRTGSETDPRVHSADIFQDSEHVQILANLTTHTNHVLSGGDHHNYNNHDPDDLSRHVQNSSSYSYGNQLSSIDSARLVVGERGFSSQYSPVDPAMFLPTIRSKVPIIDDKI